jgi:4-hydroxyphenylpyruvate dioxygenase-like putative hemolysin
MTDTVPSVHHVVFCVQREHQDEAVDFWRALGFEFAEIDLPAEGLRVLLDWDRGIEVIAPTAAGGSESAHVEQFLDQHGEGVYSVVVRTADVAGPIAVAATYGAEVEYQQHREAPGFTLDEARLAPLHGMAVTLLATDRPG